ncbi:hypothetical protein ACIQC9_09620 [Brevundimonas sp. NPDC092305]|uniref:hypothetical protein n=1 Tax=Brevundimonas sp. NPDC092305 TaxID=3363957 RepID=UPI003815459C
MTPRLFGVLAAVGVMALAATAAAFTSNPPARSGAASAGSDADSAGEARQRAPIPFELHPDIIVLSVKGFDSPDECKGPEVGVGDEELCLRICKKGPDTVRVDLHGLQFLSRVIPGATPKQDTVFLNNPQIEFPQPGRCGPGGVDTEEEEEELKAKAAAGNLPESVGTQIVLKTMCLDVLLGVPGSGDTYDLGAKVTNPQLVEILSLIAGKTLSEEGADLVQDAIWQVTNYGGLKNEMRGRLRAL